MSGVHSASWFCIGKTIISFPDLTVALTALSPWKNDSVAGFHLPDNPSMVRDASASIAEEPSTFKAIADVRGDSDCEIVFEEFIVEFPTQTDAPVPAVSLITPMA